MFQHREIGLNQSFQVISTVLLTVIYWGWFMAIQAWPFSVQLVGATSYVEYYLALMLGYQVSFLSRREQDIFSITTGVLESHRFVRPHILIALAISLFFLVLTKDDAISRTFIFGYVGLSYVALVGFSRYAAFPFFRMVHWQPPQELLLIGKPVELAKVESLLTKARMFGIEPAGWITEASGSELPVGHRKLGGPEDYAGVLAEHPGSNLFFLGSPRDRRCLGEWMRLAEAKGCRVSMVNDLDVFLQRPLSYFRCDDVDLIELREEPLQNGVNRLVKRMMDWAISLPVVIFILPLLMVMVWVIHRLQSPGPLFFRQIRSGMDNRPFTILKFRTMYADRCDSSEQVKNGDGRIFPAAVWLRRFSLDEFPQFFNVVTGQMSVVGPRPHMVEHDKLFGERLGTYAVRGFVKPGLSGLAQIRGFRGQTATDLDVLKRVESDLEYIETWSVMLDVRIVWQTLRQMVRPPKGAV